jgi:hypothetical protein
MGRNLWRFHCTHLCTASLYIPEGSNNVPHSKVLVMLVMQGMWTHGAILPTSSVHPSIEMQFQVLSKWQWPGICWHSHNWWYLKSNRTTVIITLTSATSTEVSNKHYTEAIKIIPVDDADDKAWGILIYVSFCIRFKHFLALSASPKTLSKNLMQTMHHLRYHKSSYLILGKRWACY